MKPLKKKISELTPARQDRIKLIADELRNQMTHEEYCNHHNVRVQPDVAEEPKIDGVQVSDSHYVGDTLDDAINTMQNVLTQNAERGDDHAVALIKNVLHHLRS